MTKKILIVEDDPINRLVISDFLTAHGYEIVTADDGADGVRKFLSEAPDLMIIDALLPLKSGFEVAFEVRRSQAGRNTPLLLMSAVCKDTHTAFHATTDLRAQGFFVKPFKMRDLLRSVTALVGEAN